MAHKGGYIAGFINPPKKNLTCQQKNVILMNEIAIQYRNML